MRTDNLIAALAQDDTPVRPIAPRLIALAGPALLASAAVALTMLGIRADLLAALLTPAVAMKWLLPLAVGLAAASAALRLSRPLGRPPVAEAVVAVTGAVALVWLAGAALAAEPGTLWPQMKGQTRLTCLGTITAVSALPLAIGLAILREGASPAPARSGAMLGLAVGGLAATLYALHCDEDAPLFFLTWYGLGIAIVGAAGALAGRHLLRW